jgi:SAM-dependent methyltransferase
MAESALSFALYGLDRLWTAASWVQPGARPWLNLGPGNKHIEDTHELDWPDWNGESGLIPARTESYGAVFATHFLEHLRDPRPILAEVGRVLKPGCPFNILVPLAGTGMALQDLDHKSVYTLDTWRVLLENPYYNKDNNAEFPFQIGTNFVYGSKMENLALITQLIKFGE